MNMETVSLIIGVLGFVSSFLTIIISRRKIEAERNKTEAETESIKSDTATKDVDAFEKFSDLLKKLQDRNDELYQENVELAKQNTEKARSLEVLSDRLQNRDTQLSQCSKQLDLLRNLAQESHITDTLKTQLEAMQTIISKMQDAQSETTKVLAKKEEALQELFKTNRDLELKKPPKKGDE